MGTAGPHLNTDLPGRSKDGRKVVGLGFPLISQNIVVLRSDHLEYPGTQSAEWQKDLYRWKETSLVGSKCIYMNWERQNCLGMKGEGTASVETKGRERHRGCEITILKKYKWKASPDHRPGNEKYREASFYFANSLSS